MNSRMKIAILIFLFGLGGIFSMLTMEIPLPEEARIQLEAMFTSDQIKWLLLINPTIFLVISILMGIFLYDKVGFKLPVIERLLGLTSIPIKLKGLMVGVLGGIIAGISIVITASLFTPVLPQEFLELGENVKTSLLGRFLYGGLTEEILLRFGVMTLLAWLFTRLFKSKPSIGIWISIVLSSILFAVGHFPVAYQAIGEPSNLLLLYILIGNSLGGLIFGWVYWKEGLITAMIAHIMAHVIMVLSEVFLA